jgi:hypothetical protein
MRPLIGKKYGLPKENCDDVHHAVYLEELLSKAKRHVQGWDRATEIRSNSSLRSSPHQHKRSEQKSTSANENAYSLHREKW